MRNSIRLIHIAVMITLAAVVTILPAAAQAQDQWPINFQGILLDVNGDPVTIPISVAFKIWDADVGGNELWSEVQVVTPDSDGRFNVLLGSIIPIPDAALAGGTAYIGTTVDTDPEMSPRAQLVSVGYAHRTRTVDGASGGTITGDLQVTGNIIGSTPWTALPLAPGYEDYEDAHPDGYLLSQYRKIGDVVHLRGLVHHVGHANIPQGDTVAVLPPGFRPPGRAGFYVPPFTWLSIDAGGNILIFNSPAELVRVDEVSFSTTP